MDGGQVEPAAGLDGSGGAESSQPARRSGIRRRAPNIVLVLIIVSFVVAASVIALETPAWESSDEPSHVQNIETLVSGHWYRLDLGPRVASTRRNLVALEAHQPPLYYLALAAWQRLIGKPAQTPKPGATAPGLFGQVDRSRGLLLHHREADHRFLLWLRLPNVLLGALTVLLTFLAVRTVTLDRWTPVVAAAIVAMTPRFVFLSAFVTNDNLATFLGALLTLLALRFLISPSAWRMALLGGVAGLLVVTKLSTLPVAAVVLAAVFVRRRWLDRARLTLVGSIAALATCGWYLAHNAARYGDPLARDASARHLGRIGGLGTFTPYYTVTDPAALIALHVPGRIIRGFWYTSGWNQFRWPWWASMPLWLALAVALLGLVGARAPRRVLLMLFALALAGFVSVWIVAFQTATYEPRLALTALPALAGLAALGVERWKLPLRFLLPFTGLIGLLVAMYNDVLAVNWR